MLKQTTISKRLSTKQLTKVGMLSGITVILGLTGMGFVPLPIAKATIMHIPVIIGAIIEGPIVGMLIGLIFGLFSIFQNIVSPTVLSFALINPLVSVLPRVLIGLTSYYVYKLFSKSKFDTMGIAAGTIIGSLTNTIGVLGMIYILYIDKYAAAKSLTIDAAIKVIYGIALTNGVTEFIIATIITVPVVIAIRKVSKK